MGFLLDKSTDVSTPGNSQFIRWETSCEPELVSQNTLQTLLKLKMISQGQAALSLDHESLGITSLLHQSYFDMEEDVQYQKEPDPWLFKIKGLLKRNPQSTDGQVTLCTLTTETWPSQAWLSHDTFQPIAIFHGWGMKPRRAGRTFSVQQHKCSQLQPSYKRPFLCPFITSQAEAKKWSDKQSCWVCLPSLLFLQVRGMEWHGWGLGPRAGELGRAARGTSLVSSPQGILRWRYIIYRNA